MNQRLNKMIIYNRLRHLLRKRPFWCLYIQRKPKTGWFNSQHKISSPKSKHRFAQSKQVIYAEKLAQPLLKLHSWSTAIMQLVSRVFNRIALLTNGT